MLCLGGGSGCRLTQRLPARQFDAEYVGEFGGIQDASRPRRFANHYIALTGPRYEFIRIHRSYFVNRNHLDKIEDGYVHVGKHKLPISQGYKDEVVRRLRIIN